AYAEARAAILSPRFTAALLRLQRWFAVRGWRDQPVAKHSARLMAPLDAAAPALLARLRRRGLKRARRFARLAPAERHRLRIALKEMRYASELLAPLYRKKAVRRLLRRLKPLQDDLGRANDRRTAASLAAALGARDGDAVLARHERRRAAAEAQTRQHLRRYRRVRPFW
ncbi:MAG: CHAD domain-containing protein, partial [Stellaceae bacterium]